MKLTLQELLAIRGFASEKVKLMRHTIRADGKDYRSVPPEYFDYFQAMQRPSSLEGCDYFLSFIGTQGSGAKYQGCYKVSGSEPLTKHLLPPDYPIDSFNAKIADECVFWKIEETNVLDDLINRLVIDWGKSTRTWIQSAKNNKEVLYILPYVSEHEFVSYDKVILPYSVLQEIVSNSKAHNIWEDMLSRVAGIYLITDVKTGKHYVGSASSYDNGIWGRWSNYAKTGHGGNKRLIELIRNDEDYCKNFIFSILEVFPIKRDRSEILEYEQLYKEKLQTIQHGLNDN